MQTDELLRDWQACSDVIYESVGFEARDEIMTRFRGLDDAVLAAIGQPA